MTIFQQTAQGLKELSFDQFIGLPGIKDRLRSGNIISDLGIHDAFPPGTFDQPSDIDENFLFRQHFEEGELIPRADEGVFNFGGQMLPARPPLDIQTIAFKPPGKPRPGDIRGGQQRFIEGPGGGGLGLPRSNIPAIGKRRVIDMPTRPSAKMPSRTVKVVANPSKADVQRMLAKPAKIGDKQETFPATLRFTVHPDTQEVFVVRGDRAVHEDLAENFNTPILGPGTGWIEKVDGKITLNDGFGRDLSDTDNPVLKRLVEGTIGETFNTPTDIQEVHHQISEFSVDTNKVREGDSTDLLLKLLDPNEDNGREFLSEAIGRPIEADPPSISRLQAVKKEIYQVSQQGLKDFPDEMTVYRIGKIIPGQVQSFTINPEFTGKSLPWLSESSLDEPVGELEAYTVKKSDILAAPNSFFRPGKGIASEHEVMIDGASVQAKTVGSVFDFPAAEPEAPSIAEAFPRPTDQGNTVEVSGGVKRGPTFDQEVRDFWDINLENNALRGNAVTQAGAGKAFRLENAGDVLRELTGPTAFTHPGRVTDYLTEKLDRIEGAASRGFSDDAFTELTDPGEIAKVAKIKEDIDRIPAKSKAAGLAKSILQGIANGSPFRVLKDIRDLRKTLKLKESQLQIDEEELDKMVKKLTRKRVIKKLEE